MTAPAAAAAQESLAVEALELFRDFTERAQDLLELKPNSRRYVEYEGRRYTAAEAIAAAGVYGQLAQAAANAAATLAVLEARR